MKDKFVAKDFDKNWGYLLLFSGIFSVPDNGYLSDLRIFSKCFWVRIVWGVVWIDVVSCCRFIDVEKSAYFGHLKSFFLKKIVCFPVPRTISSKKNDSWNEYFMKQKKFSQDYSKTKNIEKFLHKNYQKNSFPHSNAIFFTFTKVIFKVVQGYWHLLERYFNLPALFIFFILI